MWVFTLTPTLSLEGRGDLRADVGEEVGGALSHKILDVDRHQMHAPAGEFLEAAYVVDGHAGAGDADDFPLGQRAVDDLGDGGVHIGRGGIPMA